MGLNIQISVRNLRRRIESDSIPGKIRALPALQIRVHLQACEKHRIHPIEHRACLQEHLFPAVHLYFLAIQREGCRFLISDHTCKIIGHSLIHAESIIINLLQRISLPLSPHKALLPAELRTALIHAFQFFAHTAVDPAILPDLFGILVLAIFFLLDLQHDRRTGLLKKPGQPFHLSRQLLSILRKFAIKISSNFLQFHSHSLHSRVLGHRLRLLLPRHYYSTTDGIVLK